jgi:signal transduction histidine kinase
MNIRTRLTLRFLLTTAVILSMCSLLIYFFSADYREENFYKRLEQKATNTAKLLIEVDEVSAELLRRLEEDNPVSLPDEKIVIFNHADSLLFTTDEQQVIILSKDMIDKIRLDEQVRWRQGEFEVLGFLFKGRYDRFVVVAAASDIFGFNKLQNLLYILLSVFGLSIVTATVFGWFFAGKALEPIANVVKQVDEISINKLDLRVDEGNGQDEIARLAQTFNKMLSRLESSFLTQRTFIANASHELRTPLTAVTGQLEVTLLSKRSVDEYESVIQSVLDDIRNLNLLSNRLLLLAQSSSEERKKLFKSVRIDEAVWLAKEDISKHRPDFKINIDMDQDIDDAEKLTTDGDEQLIRIAVGNLIENACKYSDDKTSTIVIKPDDHGLKVVVSDRGIGISKEDMEKIFHPFYRGSNTLDIRGHGIGLPMVKGIMRLHDGAIELISEIGIGTTVTLSFPVSIN